MQTQSWADCRTTVSRATIVSTSGASKGLESSSARAATSPLLRRSKAFMPVARSRDFMFRRGRSLDGQGGAPGYVTDASRRRGGLDRVLVVQMNVAGADTQPLRQQGQSPDIWSRKHLQPWQEKVL